MKKYVLLLLALLTNLMTFAVPACPDSLLIIQPNGDTLWTYLHGDEFYHWRSTIDGYVIMPDTNNYFRYAIVDADSLRPSNIIAHNTENRNVLEQAFMDENSALVEQFINSDIIEIQSNNASLLPPAQHVANNTSESQGSLVGTRKILTILMEFKDYPFTKTRAEFDSLMNQRSGAVDLNMGSVRQYYQENSYGQLEVSAVVIGPFEAKNERKYYQHSSNNDTIRNAQELVREAIDHAKKHVNFSSFDGDNDGVVDGIHVVFAGEGQCFDPSAYIWSHKSQLRESMTINRKTVRKYMMTPELYRSKQLAAMGTICHELGHIFGAPDYYDTDYRVNGEFYATGQYDIMCNGSWNHSGRIPAHHNPYTKCYTFGWDTPQNISAENHHYILSSTTRNKGHFYRINTQTENEYFLLENRTKEKFDTEIPNAGLLIYHKHKDLETSTKKNNAHPLKFYIVSGFATTNPNSTPSSYGTAATLRAYPGHHANKTMFTNTTLPSATSWDGREIDANIFFINILSDGKIIFTTNPKIDGPTQLCGTRDYNVYGIIPLKDTLSWSYSTNVQESMVRPMLRFIGGMEGNSVSIKRGTTYSLSAEPIEPGDTIIQIAPYGLNNTIQLPGLQVPESPYVGTATLYATINGGNGTYQMEKEIVLPEYITPTLMSKGTKYWLVNDNRTLIENSCDSIESEYIKWYVRFPNSDVEEEYVGRSITVKPDQIGEMTVRIVNDCGCAVSNEATYTYSVVDVRPMSYPNPVTTSFLPIDIIRYDNTETLYTVDLWHQVYGRACSMSTTGTHVELDVSSLPTDWYQLVLHHNGQILDSGSVYIQH